MPEVRLIGEQAADVVTLFHRRDSLCRSKIMQYCFVSNLKIVPRWNAEIPEATGDDSVTGLSLRTTITATEFTLDATGLFFTVGGGPRSVLVA